MRRRGWLAAVGLALGACADGTAPGGGAPAAALVVVGEPVVGRIPSPPGTVAAAGRVKNTAARPYSGQVTVTLFGADGRVAGVCTAAVNDVAAGDEVTYQALGMVPEGAAWTRAEAKVSLQLPR